MKRWIFIALALTIATPAISGGDTSLHEAAKNGDAYAIKKLIDAGADVNAKNNDGDTPLHDTTRNENWCEENLDGTACIRPETNPAIVNVVKELINAGADIHAKNKIGETPLHLAVKYLDMDFVLESYPPIYVDNDNDYLIREFIKAGANINAKNNSGETPLHYAASNAAAYGESIKDLISAGADIHAKDNGDRTPCDLLKHNDELKDNSEAKKLLCR